MTTSVKRCEYRAPNGKTLRVSGPVRPVDVERLVAERDAWYERNRRLLEGYSVKQFIEEKRSDATENPA